MIVDHAVPKCAIVTLGEVVDGDWLICICGNSWMVDGVSGAVPPVALRGLHLLNSTRLSLILKMVLWQQCVELLPSRPFRF